MSQTILHPHAKTIPVVQPLIITSPAFKRGDLICSRYTLQGKNIPPPLRVVQLPQHSVSLAIIMTETDATSGYATRWLAWNIMPATYLPENLQLCRTGKNDHGVRYTGPAATYARHTFTITVFALDTWLSLSGGAGITQLEKAMNGHIITSGKTSFTYKRYDRQFRHLL